MKKEVLLACSLVGALVLGGCSHNSDGDNSQAAQTVAMEEATIENMMALNQKNHANQDDVSYVEDGATRITFDGENVQIDGNGASASDGVLSINAGGTYILKGAYTGKIVVQAGEKDAVRLVFNGVELRHDGAGIQAFTGDELVVIMADGTTNLLEDTNAKPHGEAAQKAKEEKDQEKKGIAPKEEKAENSSDDTTTQSSSPAVNAPSSSESEEDEIDETKSALLSKIDTTIGGNGTLNVVGGAHGIFTSDGLSIFGGTINVTSVDDGIHGKDYIWIEGGNINVEAGGDALQATNSTEIERGFIYMAQGDVSVKKAYKGIDAVTDFLMKDGSITIECEHEGIEAAYVLGEGGNISITSGDDTINATVDSGEPWLKNAGGTWVLNGEGDGFDSNGKAMLASGALTIYGPTHGGNGAIDTEKGFWVTGGTLFAAGPQGMDEGPNLESAQVSVKFTGEFTVDTTFAIKDESGVELARVLNKKEAQSLFYSSADIKKDATYVMYANGEEIARGKGGDYEQNLFSPGGMADGEGGPGEMGEPGQVPEGEPPAEDGQSSEDHNNAPQNNGNTLAPSDKKSGESSQQKGEDVQKKQKPADGKTPPAKPSGDASGKPDKKPDKKPSGDASQKAKPSAVPSASASA